MNTSLSLFSESLQNKINTLLERRNTVQLGSINFASPLLLAPMSSICNAPFRLLMESLGCGGTVSELISCHGINYKGEKTLNMLRLDEKEKNVGLQLFGEDKDAMAKASKVARDFNPKFIDINMGCPVRKVVGKGGGSALMKDPTKLGQFFGTIKRAIDIPLTIKIRTGWDYDSRNAHEIIYIAKEEGVEFVAIHGRTRTQQYTGKADWDYIENINKSSPLPLIGNGDLHTSKLVKERMQLTNCPAVMVGRGALRNPFIFLEPLLNEDEVLPFSPKDYLEVIQVLFSLLEKYAYNDRALHTQIRKHTVWFANGFKHAAKFRGSIFHTNSIDETMKLTSDFFGALESQGVKEKNIDPDKTFMAGGHG